VHASERQRIADSESPAFGFGGKSGVFHEQVKPSDGINIVRIVDQVKLRQGRSRCNQQLIGIWPQAKSADEVEGTPKTFVPKWVLRSEIVVFVLLPVDEARGTFRVHRRSRR
jgi:hypothetical protein